MTKLLNVSSTDEKQDSLKAGQFWAATQDNFSVLYFGGQAPGTVQGTP